MAIQRPYIRKLRYSVQILFLLFTVFIGYRFYTFVLHFEDPAVPFVQKPPSVEAFLPISGLMSLKYFLFTGSIEPFHPASLILFVAIIAVSLAMKKGFCGWICPVGTLSEWFWKSGQRLFGRNFRAGYIADICLRSIKYMLMALILLLIGVAMSPNMMVLFFISDYYKAVDVRMMNFFTDMSTITFLVLISLVGLSFVYKNFWCRYLCPYGALLGLLSRFSPVKVKRNEENCIHCHSCSENCPSLIDVENKTMVSSAECFCCMTCVSNCPSEGALDLTLKTGKERRTVKPYLYPAILLLIFYIIIILGMITGKWHSQMPYEEYKRIIPEISEKADHQS
jgi:polyferredoxin